MRGIKEVQLDTYIASLGGKARALSSRKEALEKYYKNPKYCLECGKIIFVKNNEKPAITRIKNFCNHSCSAKFSNKNRIQICKKDSKEKEIKKRKTFVEIWNNVTKEELLSKRGNYQSFRSTIRKHAYKVFAESNKPLVCNVCGYDKFAEIAHIKSVSSFENNITLKEINDINNLIALCPNCHEETHVKI